MQQLANLITSSSHTIVFTGAGMSTESGLPDFRSAEGGLWSKFNPDELANIQALETNTDEFIQFYRHRLQDIDTYKPHEGHYILGEWEKNGWIQGIITQNVDGFHHEAGNKNVMELHGSFRSLYCHSCSKRKDHDAFLSGDVYCSCGGAIRPDIVLFGEGLPQDVFTKAERETTETDLFIVLGSSLTVTPANMFPMLAKQNGARLVIVNRDNTPLDTFADDVIQDVSIKDFLIEVHGHLNR
ncbi:MAG TPA: NAD-dependent protein deacylase [Bacillota bacterium]